MKILWPSVYFVFVSHTLTDSVLNFKLPTAPLTSWEWVASIIIERNIQTIYDVQIACENSPCASNEFLKKIEVPFQLSQPKFRDNSFVFTISQSLSFVTRVLDRAVNSTRSKYVVFVECLECASVEWILEKYWQYKILNVIVVLLEHVALPTYTYFPFGERTCFDRSPVLLGNFTDSFVSAVDLFPRKVWNLHNCTLTVSAFSFHGIHIEDGKLTGRFSSVFDAVAEFVNFSVDFIHTDGKNSYGSVIGLNKTGVKGDVFVGMAHLGFGFIHAIEPPGLLDYDGLALPGCLTWCVPAKYKTHSLWWFVVGEFASSVWMTLVASAIVIIAIDYLARKLLSRNWLHGDISLARLLWAAFLQVPQRNPRYSSLSFRLLWMTCLLPSLVLSTVYLSTLKSLRTAQYKEYQVKTLEDLAAAGLQAWVFQGLAPLLDDASTSNPAVAKLRSHSYAFPPQMFYTMLDVFAYKNITTLLMDKFCRLCSEQYVDKEDFKMYPLPQACMKLLSWHLFVMARHSVFTEVIKARMGQLTQAGIVQITVQENSTLSRSTDIAERQITVRNMFPALLLLACGLCMSALAFFFEMIWSFVLRKKKALELDRQTGGTGLFAWPASRGQDVHKLQKRRIDRTHSTTLLLEWTA